MAKTIGIIGGMGPAATIDLITKIYARSSASFEQQHLHVLADIDPSIPDRTEAILTNKEGKVVAHLLKNAQGLVRQGADLLAMPCNTAHAFINQLKRELPVPFASIVDVTVDYMLRTDQGAVGIMATDGTLAAGLYIQQLEERGVRILRPTTAQQAALMRAIYAFKSGELVHSSEVANDIYNNLLWAGAECVVAACTELPIMLAQEEKVIDPTGLLAQHLVDSSRIG